jgi:MoaA/NifB/PqqE/SkfB family radical SAM enzyme
MNEINLKKFTCTKPFNSLEVHYRGECYICCPEWNNNSIGNIYQNSIDEIWNSPKAIEIRQSINDGSFKYCNHKTCPFIQAQDLPLKEKDVSLTPLEKPNYLMLNYDRSCNLSCPSCRTEKIMSLPGSPQYEMAEKITKTIDTFFIKNLEDSYLKINITGSGDPFASVIYKKFLESIDGKKHPRLLIDLQTNALLLNEDNWNNLKNIHSNINDLFISVDAATEQTYKIVRRLGNFNQLLKNLHFISNLRKQRKINLLQARFVVQDLNFSEIPSFIKLFLKLRFDVIEFSKMINWSTYSPQDFFNQCPWEKSHRNHLQFQKVLTSPILGHRRVFLGNLSKDRQEALNEAKNNFTFIERGLFEIENLNFKLHFLILNSFFKFKKIVKKLKIFLLN